MSGPVGAVTPAPGFASLTDVGRVRNHNEGFVGDPLPMAAFVGDGDRFSRLGWLFAVADGMGRHAGGLVCTECHRVVEGRTIGAAHTHLPMVLRGGKKSGPPRGRHPKKPHG